MSTKDQLSERLHKLILNSSVLQQTYVGNMSLYTAACTENNAKEIERLREVLQDIIGQVLDNVRLTHDVVRELSAGTQPR